MSIWRILLLAALIVGLMKSTHDFAGTSVAEPAPRGLSEQVNFRFSDVVALVRRRGWPADLGRFCPFAEVRASGSECVAQQIAFFEGDHRGHAFNVMPLEPETVSYVVILDLSAEWGLVYLVSPAGELISVSTLNLEPDHRQISADLAERKFQREMAFWRANVEQFDRWLEKRKFGPAAK